VTSALHSFGVLCAIGASLCGAAALAQPQDGQAERAAQMLREVDDLWRGSSSHARHPAMTCAQRREREFTKNSRSGPHFLRG